jgi:hypothetical protein
MTKNDGGNAFSIRDIATATATSKMSSSCREICLVPSCLLNYLNGAKICINERQVDPTIGFIKGLQCKSKEVYLKESQMA